MVQSDSWNKAGSSGNEYDNSPTVRIQRQKQPNWLNDSVHAQDTEDMVAIKMPMVSRMSANDAARINAVIKFSHYLEVHCVHRPAKHHRIEEVRPVSDGYFYECILYGKTGAEAHVILSAEIPLLIYISQREDLPETNQVGQNRY